MVAGNTLLKFLFGQLSIDRLADRNSEGVGIVTHFLASGTVTGWPRLLAALRSSQRAGSGSEASKPRPAVFAGDAPWKDRKSGLRHDKSCVNGGVIFEWVDTLNGFTDLLAGKIEIIGRLQVHPEIG